MKKYMMATLLVSALAIGGAALAAPQDEIVQPRPVTSGYQTVVKNLNAPTATRYEWVASSGTRAYYMALRDVTAAYPDAETDMYQLSVKETPTSYYVRDVLIPERKTANLSVAGYDQYAYSIVTYKIRVERTAGVTGNVVTAAWTARNTDYYVGKVAQKDYTADGKLLGEQSFNGVLDYAAPQSEEYTLATGVDRIIYSYRPAGR